jgi:gamma-glutamylcyclotransferase (GGCT)/AIG2-like uncharacterized protein YtfP
VSTLVFFYGTLMDGFDRRLRIGIDDKLAFAGRAHIPAALFDLGIYPAAIPDPEGRVWGEVYEMTDPASVLPKLDEIEGYTPDDPDHSLYTRGETPVTFADDRVEHAWVYFYNAPLGGAPRIPSGDYRQHVGAR